MAAEVLPSPEISVSLAIDPPSFRPLALGSSGLPTLTLTTTSHATQPITIFTWPTLFNLDLSQRRRDFTCLDLTYGTPVFLELTKGPQRLPFSREKGSSDDKFFVTLEPEISVTFQHSFTFASRPTEGRHAIHEGHRYRYAISDEGVVRNWWYGSRDDVMLPSKKILGIQMGKQAAGLPRSSGEPIALRPGPPVEFEVTSKTG